MRNFVFLLLAAVAFECNCVAQAPATKASTEQQQRSVAASATAFSSVHEFLQKKVDDDAVAGGAVLVVHDGKIVFETGFGFADIATKTSFTVETPATIASISKPILATAIYRLVEQKKVDVERPISNYLKEFGNLKLESGQAALRAPTLTELLTHTSGMRNDEAKGGRPWYASWAQGVPLSDVVLRIANFPLKAQPGTKYAYSGIGTDTAARVAEVTSGKSRNALLIQEVCQPLGMKHTFYRDGVRSAQVKMPTRYYRRKNGQLARSRKRSQPKPDSYTASGGSVISTVHDLARWLSMIRNHGRHDGSEFLNAGTIEQMLKPNKTGYNAKGGLFVRRRNKDGKPVLFSHTGSSGTNCWIDVEHDVIGIMLTQTRGRDIKPFRSELQERIMQCVTGVVRKP